MIWSWIQLPSPKATLAQSSKVPLQVMLSYSLPSSCIWTSSSNAFCHLCASILLNNLHASCMHLHSGIHVNKATNQRYLKLYDFWWCVHEPLWPLQIPLHWYTHSWPIRIWHSLAPDMIATFVQAMMMLLPLSTLASTYSIIIGFHKRPCCTWASCCKPSERSSHISHHVKIRGLLFPKANQQRKEFTHCSRAMLSWIAYV
jgi:hypothetical protein